MREELPGRLYSATPATLDRLVDRMLVETESLAELKVSCVILRNLQNSDQTQVVLSLSRLNQLTGLSRQGVIDGIRLLLARGYIQRVACGNGFAYRLSSAALNSEEQERLYAAENRTAPGQAVSKVSPVDDSGLCVGKQVKRADRLADWISQPDRPEQVHSADRLSEPGSQAGRPEPVSEIDQSGSLLEIVNSFDCQSGYNGLEDGPATVKEFDRLGERNGQKDGLTPVSGVDRSGQEPVKLVDQPYPDSLNNNNYKGERRGEDSNINPPYHYHSTSTGTIQESDRAQEDDRQAAVEIYHEITGLTPGKLQAQLILEQVVDPDLWRQVLTNWLAKSYNPSRVEAILDKYHKTSHAQEYSFHRIGERGFDYSKFKPGGKYYYLIKNIPQESHEMD
ncbi:MAG TPA: hypothetical protein VH186_25295 [Chloroflexia bacterium]|nr:hypothetical protein [Chloroflexia bacterium]